MVRHPKPVQYEVSRKTWQPDEIRSVFVQLTTANQEVAGDITNAFVASGIPVEATNIDSIPNQSAFHLEGNSSVPDSFRTVYRVVLPVSFVSRSENSPSTFSDDIDKMPGIWKQEHSRSILITGISCGKEWFPAAMIADRSVGKHEKDMVGSETFQALLSAIKSRYGKPQCVSKRSTLHF